MKPFNISVAILASPQRVWQVLSDVERWPEWTPSVLRITRLDSALLAIGSRVRIEQPKLRPAMWTVTAWCPEKNFAWVSSSLAILICAEHVIEATADGCIVTLTLRFEGLFGALVGRLARSLINRYLALEAAGLKKRSERLH